MTKRERIVELSKVCIKLRKIRNRNKNEQTYIQNYLLRDAENSLHTLINIILKEEIE